MILRRSHVSDIGVNSADDPESFGSSLRLTIPVADAVLEAQP